MYKIKVYRNGKLFAEYDLDEYMLMDKNGQAFVSTGENPQAFIMKAIQGQMDGDTIEGSEPEVKQRKTPTMKDKMALKYHIDKMDKDAH